MNAFTRIKLILPKRKNILLPKGRVLFLCFLLLCPLWASAKHITQQEAVTIAQKFYQARIARLQPVAAARLKASSISNADFKLGYVAAKSGYVSANQTKAIAVADSTAYFYIYNVGGNQGFVIVAGDNVAKPVLGYSLQGSFATDHIPSNVQNWLNIYKTEIKAAQQKELNPSLLGSVSTAQSSYSSTQQLNDSVAPLLGNIMWDQDTPYNLLCPYNTTYKERTETGCVATAMAQIMKYYQWPVTGTGSYSYSDSPYGTLSANFGTTTYNWSKMLDSYGATTTGAQDTAVATLMYDCGVAVKMQYDIASNGGSAASTSDAGIALVKYFGYDSGIQSYDRSLYTENQWETLLRNELKASRPVLYAGTTDSVGHAFVIDGFDSSDLYHINWGWSGLFDGYFQLTALNPDWPGSNIVTGGFSENQQMIAGIQKPTGTSHVNYVVGIYSKGLTSSVSSLSSIATQTFSLSYGFMNFGINSFSGTIGIGLYQNGTLQKTLGTTSVQGLNSYYYYPNISFSNVSLSGLSSGTYQIYCIYQPTDSTSWSKVKQSGTYNNYLNVTIAGSSASITKPVIAPVLALTQPIQVTQNAYYNKTGVFNVSIHNSGTEFYSDLALYIYSKTDSTANHQYVDYGVVCIPSDSTINVTFSGTISCPVGTYYAVALNDSTNSYSIKSYKQLTPSSDNFISFNVLNTPTSPNLILNSPIVFTNGSSTIYNNQTISLTANITNQGGYFDSTLVAFVFPTKGGYSLTTLNPKTIYLDTNGTQTVTITGSIDLDPGQYSLGLYYYAGGWVECSPAASAQLIFTLNNLNTAVTNVQQSSFSIYPNPASNMLYINGLEDDNVFVTICDVSGKIVLSKNISGNSLDISALANGLYIMKISTTNRVETTKFIKQ
ncbi:thiol protease/hemagglutinin PrtT [Microbacter margulisiae]|uniref:Por secretion system C-terminal sorting domain-containing protein n=1 Tax=Microbacter margulisiae TaxID=1350067 RepID=A0A7W5H0N5_9PORP|nr:thiol protease/hemagglutinin PrtT [Microbacter margulisiae]MBB3185885.1 hypothetical protein [Microbacter margulisiae]